MGLQRGRCRLPELLGDMTQTEFAKRLGVSDPFVSKLIKGEKHFSLELAVNAAYILNCLPEDLYEWNVVPSKRS